MSTLQELGKLVDEINGLCDKVSQENSAIVKEIDLRKEKAYFDMCTFLAPYWEFCKAKEMCVYVDACGEYRIRMDSQSVKLLKRERQTYVSITHSGDFISYEKFKQHCNIGRFLDFEKFFKDNSWQANIEKLFVLEVNRQMTLKAERLNLENETLKEMLR